MLQIRRVADKRKKAPTYYPITGGRQVLVGHVEAKDGTRYDLFGAVGGTRRRNPPKPYRNKAERKQWKQARRVSRGSGL